MRKRSKSWNNTMNLSKVIKKKTNMRGEMPSDTHKYTYVYRITKSTIRYIYGLYLYGNMALDQKLAYDGTL